MKNKDKGDRMQVVNNGSTQYITINQVMSAKRDGSSLIPVGGHPDGSNVSVFKMDVTPELAREFLNNQRKNRKISKSYVQNYKNIMERGYWKATPKSIVSFDVKGRLFDGQHRLNGLIKSGKEFVTMFVSANESETIAQAATDLGKPKTLVNIIAIAGIEIEEIVLKALIFANEYSPNSATAWKAASKNERLDMICQQLENTKIKSAVDFITNLYHSISVRKDMKKNSAAWAIILRAASMADERTLRLLEHSARIMFDEIKFDSTKPTEMWLNKAFDFIDTQGSKELCGGQADRSAFYLKLEKPVANYLEGANFDVSARLSKKDEERFPFPHEM